MSATLVYQIIKPNFKSLSDELKFAIRDKYFNGESVAVISYEDKPYFQGLSDAGIKDAKKIVEILEKGEAIELRLEY